MEPEKDCDQVVLHQTVGRVRCEYIAPVVISYGTLSEITKLNPGASDDGEGGGS